jgi:hypothetical protein
LVDTADYVMWRIHMSAAAASASAALLQGAVVPEPATIIVLGFLAGVFFTLRVKRLS